jgi:hypothetical protein
MKQRRLLYKSLEQKTLENMIIRELVVNFGYDNQLAVAETLAERVLSIVKTYSPPRSAVKPGQMVWLAVDATDRPGRGKSMAQTKLKPVIVTIVSQEDIHQLNNGVQLRKLLPDVVARILLETEEQGGVFSLVDVAAILNCSVVTVSKAREAWEKLHKKKLPTRGSIHDLGMTHTHKKEIIGLHLDGYFTSEIGRKTGHDPACVDRYIDDFQRVLLLAQDGQTVSKISFYTGLTRHVIQQYLEIIKERKVLKNQSLNQKMVQ